MKSTIVLIDGGFLRSKCNKAGKTYDPAFIDKFARGCIGTDEECLRILYYDCAPYAGATTLPVSKRTKVFTSNDGWLHKIAGFDLFAVRRGVLKFRGYKPDPKVPAGTVLTDAHFFPDFEQKGVDMRIGLDIASYSAERLAQRIVLVTNDTDCVPAMKFARKCGLQTVLIKLPNCKPAPELIAHADFKRPVTWP